MKYMTIVTGLVFMVAGMAAAGDKNPPTGANNGFAWKSDISDDCPFDRSKTLTGIFFTSRHRDYFLNFPSKFISEDGKTLWLCVTPRISVPAGTE